MATPNNLPAEVSSFVGREHQLAELRRLLHRSRLVTLTGPGGAGKTRLALRLAGDLVERHRDGVFLIELAPVTDARLLEVTVATACGVREQRKRPILEVLLKTLATSRMLLVLDSCEHLVEPCAALVSRIQRSCPKVTVIATSREPLGLPGEVIWRTPSLTVPTAEDGARPELLLQREAVRLFVERARLSRPALELDSANSAPVAAICGRLEGIPLAIELAAGLARVLTFEDILARLSDRFRLLTGGSRTALPRHQTLRAAVDWSYGLLGADEKELLVSLSLFAGGFDLAAAEDVASNESLAATQVLPLLTRLVDKSLVVAEPGATQQTRYRMLDTIREYSFEKLLERGERDIRERHSLHFLEFCKQGRFELRHRNQLDWLKRLDEEQGNIRLAVEWSLLEDPVRALELAVAMDRYWIIRGRLAEAIDWLDRVLATDASHPAGRTDALLTRSRMRWVQGDFEGATRDVDAGAELADKLGASWSLFAATTLRGVLKSGAGDWEAAARLHETAFQIAWQLRDPWWVASSLNNLGLIALERGDYEVARGRLEQALEGFRQAGDRYVSALSRDSLARIYIKLENSEAARLNFLDALNISLQFSDGLNVAAELEGLAEVELSEGQPQRAIALMAAAKAVRALTGADMPREYKKVVEDNLASARAKLARNVADAAWREGSTMTIEEAVRYATGGRPQLPAAANGASPLTARETEVARLIAKGLTNPEIASRLHMAERTADAHVEHIRNKLGLRARSQIAVWAHERLGTA
jgi:non-specific serine/threonine protein kinase